MKKFFRIIFTFIFVILLCFLGISFFLKKEFVAHKTDNVEIFEGASVKDISNLLEGYGVISNSDYFYYYIKVKSKYYDLFKDEEFPILFKEGIYSVEDGDFDDLISQLNSGLNSHSSNSSFTLAEGRGIDDLISSLNSLSLGSEEEILQILQSESFYNNLRNKFSWLPEYNPNKIYQLEGYLHPNTYSVDKNSTLETVIDNMIGETNKIFEQHINDLARLNLTFDQLLTLASVVEAESKFSEDRPKVAQVFYNRMILGMKLESDITASYANQEHKVFMYYEDIKTDSPYNTYVTIGLPLGPINSPSLESIVASIFPEGNTFDAIYFYARPSGETFYAKTFEEHEKNRLAYENEWKVLENQNP